MKEFRELLETRRDGPDAVVTAAAGWAAIERTLADEPAFAACPPPARLRVWLQVLKQLIDAEHAAWETEDRARLRKERKRAARACDHTCMHPHARCNAVRGAHVRCAPCERTLSPRKPCRTTMWPRIGRWPFNSHRTIALLFRTASCVCVMCGRCGMAGATRLLLVRRLPCTRL